MTATVILPLNTNVATLSRVGGKGVNLALMAQAGFPVPDGFLVTTEAYRAYLTTDGLAATIATLAEAANPAKPAELEAAATEIRAHFAVDKLSPAFAETLTATYLALGSPPVAVRSSATAEDLPDLSFAGQQETYLNVVGESALMEAVVSCWSSLWTARAIGYRAHNAVGQQDLTLAVVVQRMINSTVSGVLFTANPLTGLRNETVIDATLGLGEALVSGLVEPDQYRVNATQRRILDKKLGAKAVSIRPQAGGGTVVESSGAATQQALPDAVILDLALLGQQVAHIYGAPQDIEWAWADGQLYLLQTRAITSLYPLPAGLPETPTAVLLSFGAVQGMLDPITPLGQDVLKGIAALAAQRFGISVTHETQGVFLTAGERLFINFTGIIQSRFGRKIWQGALGFIEPGSSQVVEEIWKEPTFNAPGKISLRTLWQLAQFFAPIVVRVLANWANPEKARARIYQGENAALEVLAACDAAATTLAEQLALIQGNDPLLINGIQTFLLPAAISGIGVFQALQIMAAALPGKPSALEIARGLPHNVTTEMDLALWACAQTIRSSPEAVGHFAATDAADLAAEWKAQRLLEPAQGAVDAFMKRYGMRGLAEIDMGRPRWREDAAPVFHALQSYLQITAPEQAPDAVFAKGAVAAETTLNTLIATARRTRGGALRARLMHFLGTRVRELTGLRENPKFFAIRMMGIHRAGLLRVGGEMVKAGTLTQPDDLFYLRLNELKALADGENRDWKAIVAEHRATYQRELRRRQSPRLLLGDGRAFYAGMGAETGDDELHGSPVSPGLVENVAHVILDPRGAQLTPGEILVCPGTDPSWTPLFLTAGGLVMEVGGMMTHGAVVAREYGIPAVVGVHEATTRLKTGQRIRVDGATGRIIVINEA
ncbi:MAG: phosphoenolpyruvate synthase [Anaerolineae bacterium]|nr:phosphoenolpyruvate synthase [Anaerolineae bacterium]